MNQEQALEQLTQRLKKNRKRCTISFGVWYAVMLTIYFSSSDANLTMLSIANVNALLGFTAANLCSEQSLIELIKVINQNSATPTEQ